MDVFIFPCKLTSKPAKTRIAKKKPMPEPLLFKRHKAVRFLISPKIKKVKIEVNKIMNPAFFKRKNER